MDKNKHTYFPNEVEKFRPYTDAQVLDIVKTEFRIKESIKKIREKAKWVTEHPHWYTDTHQINQKTLTCEKCSANMREIHAGKLECGVKRKGT